MKIDRLKVLNKYNSKCAYCGCSIDIKSMQVDHIFPKHIYQFYFNAGKITYGLNDPVNLNPSCRSCNNYKSGNQIEQFRKNIESQVRIHKSRPTFRLTERFGLIECIEKPVIFYFETYEGIPTKQD